VTTNLNAADDDQLLESLPVASGAPTHALEQQNKALCLKHARVAVLNDIIAWAKSHDSHQVYWLNGLAGTGQSTIARQIARRFADETQLGASFFFFRRGRGNLGSARKFVTTVALKLAVAAPGLQKHIAQAVRACHDVGAMALLDQLTRIVLEPLAKYSGSGFRRRLFPKRWLIVVDALDECDAQGDLGHGGLGALSELVSVAASTESYLRVFITSRPETPILFRFDSIPENRRQHFILHRIEPHDVNQDLLCYFTLKLRQVGVEALGHCRWPSDESLKSLVTMAEGLFIWAATACEHIRQGKAFADRCLQDVLLVAGCETVCKKKLCRIYTMVLENTVSGDYSEAEAQEICCLLLNILGTLAVLHADLDVESLALLCDIPLIDVLRVLPGLRSVLDTPDNCRFPIQLHHASFRDFILASPSHSGLRFTVDP
jgi:hypothetical protein